MPYRMPVVSEKFQRVRGRSRSAWHGGGAGQKRRIRAVRDRAAHGARGQAQSFGAALRRQHVAGATPRRTGLVTLPAVPAAARPFASNSQKLL